MGRIQISNRTASNTHGTRGGAASKQAEGKEHAGIFTEGTSKVETDK
jgi:hypothetical protein